MNIMKQHTFKILALMLIAALLQVRPALAQSAAIDLCATSGTIALPGTAALTIWGYTLGDCTTGLPLTAPGGPTIVVNEGDTVAITVHNNLPEATSLLLPSLAMIPDTTGIGAVASATYNFTADAPGLYLYEAGLLANAQHQVAMGLYGALVVRSATAGTAYGTSSTAFDDEAVLVLGEIDPALNNSAAPASFDMRNYAPKYFLINGKAYPDTAPIATQAGNNVLLRYVNAGLVPYSMSLLGMRQTAVAMDGSPFTYGRTVVAETIAPGQTADMIATVPAAATDGSKFALFDGNLLLHNNKTNNVTGGFGGMLTFLTVGGTPPTGDTTGPVTSNLSVSPTAVSGTVSDAATGGSNVNAAEFFIDTTGANGSGTAVAAFTPGVTVNVNGTIAPALTGSHTIYLHGMDAAGNWGAFQSVLLTNDATGPTTSALVVSPTPNNGTADLFVSATADDSATGGSAIAAAEYWIDTGSPSAMSVSPAAVQIASLSTTVPAATINGLTEGVHTVSVRSQDALGNWGAAVSTSLTVDKNGPATSNVNAAPNPNNGAMPINSSTPAVRVTATFVDALSKIGPECVGAAAAATGDSPVEGTNHIFIPLVTGSSDAQVYAAAAPCMMGELFIDTVGANGSGIVILPSDGSANSQTENGYADIPLGTIATLSDGNHTIYVHGQDAAGNWGPMGTTILVIDKTVPTITSVTLSANTIAFGAATVTLNVTATDGGVGLNGGQYWIDGTATPPATATAFAGTSVAINTSGLAGGVHTLFVRMKDGVSNWSAVSSATLTVVQAVNDARSITANTSGTQTSNANATAGVLTNDQPVGVAGRTAGLASAPIRTSGTGAGTITLSCPTSLGTPASPTIGGNTICTNGAYRVTLHGVGGRGNQRRASKRGTYQFTYTETLNGVSSTATVTITVN